MSDKKGVALFTSIMPRKLDEQFAALSTWRDLAERIVTVNERREAALLTDLPDWIEQYSFEDNTPYDRFYVRLSKLAEAMGSATDCRHVAFCNSDISLAKAEELERVLDSDGADLIFSSRTDTDEHGAPLSVYTDGWDFFAFRPGHARVISRDDLYIGLPWWDFFVPLAFLKEGLVANRLDGSHVHHIKHAQNWDKTEFNRKGSIVLEAIVGVRRQLNEKEVHRFAHHVNTFLNSHNLEGHRPSQEAAISRLIALWEDMHAPPKFLDGKLDGKVVMWSREIVERGYGALAVGAHHVLKHAPAVHRVVRSGHRRIFDLIKSKPAKEQDSYHNILSAPREYRLKTRSGQEISCEAGVPLAVPDQPATFVFGIFKGGSTLLNVMLEQILAVSGRKSINLPNQLRAAGLVIDEIAEDLDGLFERKGVVYGGFRSFSKVLKNSPNFAEANKLLLVRDPRDILVSLYFSHAYSHSVPESGIARQRAEETRQRALATGIDDYALHNANSVCTHLMNLGEILSDKTTLVRYEDIIFDKMALARTICATVGVEINPVRLAKIAARNDIRPEKEDKHSHIRSVAPGDHKNKLKPETIAELNEVMKPVFDLYYPELVA